MDFTETCKENEERAKEKQQKCCCRSELSPGIWLETDASAAASAANGVLTGRQQENVSMNACVKRFRMFTTWTSGWEHLHLHTFSQVWSIWHHHHWNFRFMRKCFLSFFTKVSSFLFSLSDSCSVSEFRAPGWNFWTNRFTSCFLV